MQVTFGNHRRAASTRSPALFSALVNWWRENLPQRGLVTTVRMFCREMWDFLCDCTPSRRRQRFGDIEFDCDYRVETTAANVSLRDHLLGVLAGGAYQPCDPALFHETLQNLRIDYGQFDFIDLGCGKGRALLLASDYPFRRILGVELFPGLKQICDENIRQYSSPRQRCFALESICSDARNFEFPAVPAVLFLFNPLPEAGLQRVIRNLERSLTASPRQVVIIYHNPIREHVLAASNPLTKISSSLQCAVYGSREIGCDRQHMSENAASAPRINEAGPNPSTDQSS